MNNLRVLIVDDDRDYCQAFKDFLKARGIRADTVFDGDAAQDLIQSMIYDFIFFDFNLPGVSGIDLSKIIKEYNPKAKKILVTGYNLVDESYKKVLGLDILLKKPLKLSQLYNIIESAL